MSDTESLSDDEIKCDKNEANRKGANKTENLHKLTVGIAHGDILDIKKELEKIVHDVKEREALPDVVAELIERNNLNIMVVDLYDFVEGFAVSFRKYGDDKEMFHGKHSYAVSLIQYIRDGEIPYEVFDDLYEYKQFKIFYDGYVICQIRIHFAEEKCLRSHFVLLKHTIQTIDAECSMKCMVNKELNFDEERARLIKYYSPDLCLAPDPAMADIVIANELNQHPFMTTKLKHLTQNEKARREKCLEGIEKSKLQEFTTRNLKKSDNLENWNFRLKDPEPEEVKLAETGSNLEHKNSIETYLRGRRICFPDRESCSGYVEIEHFIYEYDYCCEKKGKQNIKDYFCIAVQSAREFYYGAYQLFVETQRRKLEPFCWWEIGNRQCLDAYLNTFTRLQMERAYERMKITHCRMFDEQYEYSDGKTRIISQKLEVPICQEVLNYSASSSEDENE